MSAKRNVVRARDAKGNLLKAGYEWTEFRPRVVALGAGLSVSGAFSFWIGQLAVDQGTFPEQVTDIFLLVALAMIGIGLVLMFMLSRRPRALIFHRDGKMKAAHGLPGYEFWYRSIQGHHNALVSVEQRLADGVGHTVVVVSIGGELIRVSHNLSEAESLKVAAELTSALDALRKEEPRGPEPTFSPSPGRLRLVSSRQQVD